MRKTFAAGMFWTAALVWFACALGWALDRDMPPAESTGRGMDRALALATDRLDALCDKAAASLTGLGGTYAAALGAARAPGETEKDALMQNARRQGPVVGFKTGPGEEKREPAYQSPGPALYSYAGPDISEAAWRELAALPAIFSELRRLHDELDLSWVYLTTVNDSFAIYPFLPLSDAMNNDRPTRQAFYAAADLAGRKAGWTEPYLDLAGAGMMLTVSCPVYDGDNLLGVASRDITLKQIAFGLDAAAGRDGVAALMDARGLVVAVSGPYAEEIETAGGGNGKATLHYRSAEALRGRDAAEAVNSAHEFLNAAGEAAVDKARGLAPGEAAAVDLNLKQTGYHVTVRKTRTSGWLAVGIETIKPGRENAP
ncbi:MAG: PDC sensor domain-containing protein [Desulfovibrionaceae bacterium]|nr:PDC sensor domain-containing protein [Desulfovibrionaceae bacterium]MBF0514649.1 PDC sensor domain-containing protein [Desulfovibrionaceae bacterium]